MRDPQIITHTARSGELIRELHRTARARLTEKDYESLFTQGVQRKLGRGEIHLERDSRLLPEPSSILRNSLVNSTS